MTPEQEKLLKDAHDLMLTLNREPTRSLNAPMLSTADRQSDAALKVPAPGEGGWVPTTGQRFAGTIGATVLGAFVPVLLTVVPPPWNLLASTLVGGLALGVSTFLGVKSAGPRTGKES